MNGALSGRLTPVTLSICLGVRSRTITGIRTGQTGKSLLDFYDRTGERFTMTKFISLWFSSEFSVYCALFFMPAPLCEHLPWMQYIH